MNVRPVWFTLLFLLWLPATLAQAPAPLPADLEGDIVNSTTGAPISGARIKLGRSPAEPMYTRADAHGHFNYPPLCWLSRPFREELGNPDQVGIVGDPFVGDEVPVFRVAEALRVAIEESEVGALAADRKMVVVLLGDGGELAIVKQPDGQNRPGEAGDSRLVARADAVDVFVEAIVEEVVAVAAAGVGGADPNRKAGIHVGIGAPGDPFV